MDPLELKELSKPDGISARDGRFSNLDQRGAPAPFGAEPTMELDLAELLAWCDRSKLVDAIDEHLRESDSPQAALLAVAGDAANRIELLMNRMGAEQEEPPRNRRLKVMHIRKDYGFDNPSRVGKAALEELGLRKAAEVAPWIAKQNLDLVLLCHYADCTDWPIERIDTWFRNAAAWLQSLELQPQQRLLLLTNLRYTKARASWLRRLFRSDIDVLSRIETAHVRASKTEPLASSNAGELVTLGDYPKEDLRKWLSLERVRNGLGRVAGEIDEAKLDQWFSGGCCEHAELLGRLRQFLGSRSTIQRAMS